MAGMSRCKAAMVQIFWQRGYQEPGACSGTGSAIVFSGDRSNRQVLGVVTEGEEDEAGTYHAGVSRVYLKRNDFDRCLLGGP